MPGPKLDSAGAAKLNTLDDALLLWQRLNGLVELYALAVKGNKPAPALMMNLRRQIPALATLLKGQFGMISDQVTAVGLAATRGSEQMRVRALREGMAQIRQALDIGFTQTKEKHTTTTKRRLQKHRARRLLDLPFEGR